MELTDGLGKRRGVPRGHDKTALAVDDELWAAARIRHDRRYAISHRLDDGPRQAFAFRRRQAEDIAGCAELGGIADPADAMDAFRGRAALDAPGQLRRIHVPDQEQVHIVR